MSAWEKNMETKTEMLNNNQLHFTANLALNNQRISKLKSIIFDLLCHVEDHCETKSLTSNSERQGSAFAISGKLDSINEQDKSIQETLGEKSDSSKEVALLEVNKATSLANSKSIEPFDVEFVDVVIGKTSWNRNEVIYLLKKQAERFVEYLEK